MPSNIDRRLPAIPDIIEAGNVARNRRRHRNNRSPPPEGAARPSSDRSEAGGQAQSRRRAAAAMMPRPVTPPNQRQSRGSLQPLRSGWSSSSSSSPASSRRVGSQSVRSSYASVAHAPMLSWQIQQQHQLPSMVVARPGQTLTTHGLDNCIAIAVASDYDEATDVYRHRALAHFAGEFAAPRFCDELVAQHATPTAFSRIYFATGIAPSSWYAQEQLNTFTQELYAAVWRAGLEPAAYPVEIELVQTREGFPPGEFTLYPNGVGFPGEPGRFS